MKNEYFYEIANFVCKFNENNLMDLFDEIVYPAFTSEKNWKVKQGNFFFKDVQLVNLGDKSEKTLALVGRFVRDTVLKRQQIYNYESSSLVQDESAMQTSPSAIFVLILNNHRLIYLKETSHAPTVEMFRKTALTFLRRNTKYYMEAMPKEERLEFIQEYGLPDLRITPLTSKQSLASFIRSYNLLETVKITLKTRNNDEINNADFIESLQEISESLNSKSTTLIYQNKEGLDKEEMIEQIQETTKHTNQYVQLVGLSSTGEVVKGDNDNFKIIQSISGISLGELKKVAKSLFKKVKKLKEDNSISLPKTEDSVKEKLDNLNCD